MKNLIQQYKKSVKSLATEEKLDLWIYRPLGFVIAKISARLNLWPTHLSIMGLLIGVLAGHLFYYNDSTTVLVWGAVLFVLSGIFDSADGQLARLTGRGTRVGLILDGICDNVVFFSVYVHSILTVAHLYGGVPAIVLIGLIAGFCQSLQSATLDFFNREYLYFGMGYTAAGDYWNPNLNEARGHIKKTGSLWEKFVFRMRYTWLFQQHVLSPRKPQDRLKLREMAFGANAAAFRKKYRQLNYGILRGWQIMGPKFHTVMMILFIFLRRFDLYLIFVNLLFLNIIVIVMRYAQKRQDRKLMDWVGRQT